MSPSIDTNDFNTKVKSALKFLQDGNRVKVTVRFRGREMAHTSLGAELLEKFGADCGEVAVVALGKCGSREMTARSDLDLMTFYRAADPAAASAGKGWAAETFYGRFTQRLVAALSAPTGEGGLYEVDLQLRPSGTKGPVAVSAAAFADYYARYGTTEERDGWHMANPTGNKVIYVKAG